MSKQRRSDMPKSFRVPANTPKALPKTQNNGHFSVVIDSSGHDLSVTANGNPRLESVKKVAEAAGAQVSRKRKAPLETTTTELRQTRNSSAAPETCKRSKIERVKTGNGAEHAAQRPNTTPPNGSLTNWVADAVSSVISSVQPILILSEEEVEEAEPIKPQKKQKTTRRTAKVRTAPAEGSPGPPQAGPHMNADGHPTVGGLRPRRQTVQRKRKRRKGGKY